MIAARELETDRLRLRQFDESDLDGLYAFYADPESRKVYDYDLTRDDVWRRIALFLGHWQIRGFGTWAIDDKASGAFAGCAALWFPLGWADIEIGYGIHPAFRRRGFAAEAASRVRDHGYHDLGLKRLVSYIEPSNTASAAVATRLGATADGEFLLHGKQHIVYLHRNTDQKE